jgi:multiple sugar transport system ATP-binding protein
MRVQTRTDIARLQAELGVTTVYVTHDQIEAMTMGDRVAVMDEGVIQQVDTPLRLYDKPANLFVAGFIGSPQMNLIAATASGGLAHVGGYDVPLGPPAAAPIEGDVVLGVRPEAWRLVGPGEGLPVKVTVVEELGADGYVYGTCDVAGTPATVVVRVPARTAAGKGEVIHVTTEADAVHVFEPETGQRLSA